MATVATISVNFANYGTSSFTPGGVTDRSINPLTLSQYCLGSSTGDFSYIGGFVKKTGDTMSGMLTLPLTMPTNDNHATRKAYVDSRINSLSSTISDTGSIGYVRISGSTMTGMLTLPTTDPTNINHSTRKGYVDSRIDSLSGQVNNVLAGNPGYLKLNGGTMSGVINMGNSKITQLPTTGLNDTDAVPKKYVDDAIGGGTSGLVSKAYVDSADGLRVLKAGDTMTGALTLPASNPTSDNQAARKKYVDEQVATRATPTDVSTAAGLRVLKAGDTMTGTLNIAGTTNVIGVNTGPTGASIDVQASVTGIDNNAAYMAFHRPSKYAVRFGLDNDNKLKVGGWSMGNVAYEILNSSNWSTYIPNQASNDGRYVLKAGDTMSGFLTLNANPTSNFHAATKQYVDNAVGGGTSGLVSKAYVDTADGLRVLKAGDTMSGFLTLHSNPTSNLHAATKQYVDTGLGGKADSASLGLYLPLRGGTLTNFLTLHSNPTSNLHAATKQYVDTGVSAATTAANTAKTAADNAATAAAAANTNANNRVLRSGDTMTGSLAVQGSITATLDITAYSDKRLKKNILDIEDALNKISKLKGVSFERNSDDKKSIGVIAQDVLNVLPEVINEDKDGYLSVAYGNIVALLIEGIKELSNKVDNLEKQLNK
jgi:hypothetical protein